MTGLDKFNLKWEKFETNLKTSYASFRQTPDFSDVTLVCADGKQINAHKVILATASPFFYNIFQTNNHPNPLIYMKGLKWSDVSDIIDFIYHGEISLAQQNITEFLETAEDLKLKGLSKSSYIDMLENEQLENDETQKGNIEHTAKENNIVQSIKSEPLKFQDNAEDQSNDLPNSHSCNYCPNSYEKQKYFEKHIWIKHSEHQNLVYANKPDKTSDTLYYKIIFLRSLPKQLYNKRFTECAHFEKAQGEQNYRSRKK